MENKNMRIPILDNPYLYTVDYESEYYILYKTVYDNSYYVHSKIDGDGFKCMSCKNMCIRDVILNDTYIEPSIIKTWINCDVDANCEDTCKIQCPNRID